jgi:uncharacterized membrane protein
MTEELEVNAPQANQELTQASTMPSGMLMALAYFTVIPAIFFLLVKRFRQNRFVRFHAWQSLLLFGLVEIYGRVIPGVVDWLNAADLPGFHLDMTEHIYRFGPQPATLAIILWALFGLMAYRKKLFKFPILGDLAEML